MSKDTSVLLEMKNITKEFPGVRALDGVSFTLKKGSVHALMGENGAGKSTLMKCLFGINSIDGGEIFLEGKQVTFKNPNDALSHGVASGAESGDKEKRYGQHLAWQISNKIWIYNL